MLGFAHVDEIDDDDASHVAQTQLSGDLFRGFHIDQKRVFFLCVFLIDAVAAVDVDDVHGLGVFNDEVNTVSDGDHFAEKAFDLL